MEPESRGRCLGASPEPADVLAHVAVLLVRACLGEGGGPPREEQRRGGFPFRGGGILPRYYWGSVNCSGVWCVGGGFWAGCLRRPARVVDCLAAAACGGLCGCVGVRVALSRSSWVGAAPGGIRPRSGGSVCLWSAVGGRPPLRADTPRYVPCSPLRRCDPPYPRAYDLPCCSSRGCGHSWDHQSESVAADGSVDRGYAWGCFAAGGFLCGCRSWVWGCALDCRGVAGAASGGGARGAGGGGGDRARARGCRQGV